MNKEKKISQIIGTIIGVVIGLTIAWLIYHFLGFEITVLLYLISINLLLSTITGELKETKTAEALQPSELDQHIPRIE